MQAMYHVDAFSMSSEQKENCSSQYPPVFSSKQSANFSEQSMDGSRQAFVDLSNTGRYAESFLVYEDGSCRSNAHKTASTSNRFTIQSAGSSRQKARRSEGGVKKQRQEWIDIDANNKNNPLACSDYAQSIFEHLNTAELTRRPNPHYMNDIQHEMTQNMRCILVDWCIEVAIEYRLTSDTLFLSMNLLDRYLSLVSVPRDQLQLAGIACIWAASKYEEIFAPAAKDFCFITDNTYSVQQLVDMEAKVLSTLHFELTVPTCKTFLRRYLQAAGADEELHYLSAFLAELSLMHEDMLQFVPSEVAAASVNLGRRMLHRKAWDPTLKHYSGYEEADLCECIVRLAELHRTIMSEGQFTAIKEKYNSRSLLGVAATPAVKLPNSFYEAAAMQAAAGRCKMDS